MWNGRWSEELDNLCGMYYDTFGVEPDVQPQIDYDNISYNLFKESLKKSVVLNIALEDILKAP